MRANNRLQWRQQSYLFGLRAERLAGWLLRIKGYKVLHQRWASPVGELDMVVRRGSTLVFVEVKARQSIDEAMLAIRPHQRARIARGAQDFLRQHPEFANFSMRFDAIVIAPHRLPRHIVNAFENTH